MGEVHLVHEHEGGHPIALEQPPERGGVARDAVVGAHEQDRVVEHLQRALRLGGEVHVARRVEQHEVRARIVEHRLLGEDGDAAGTLDLVGVEVGVAMVDAPELTDAARVIEHRLGKRRLARVHVRDDAHDSLLHPPSSPTPAIGAF